MNNLRNLAVAIINYDATYGSFPPAVPSCASRAYNTLGREQGVDCVGPNWAMQILSQMEEQWLYEQVLDCIRTQWHACDDCESQPGNVGRLTPAYMNCPSATLPRKLHHSAATGLTRLSKGNYAACVGAEHYRTAIEKNSLIEHESDDRFQVGVLSVVMIDDYARLTRLTQEGKINGEWKYAQGQGVRSPQIKDGTSRTIVLSEVLTWDGDDRSQESAEDIRGVWTLGSMGASLYTHKFGPNSPMPDRINGCDTQITRRIRCSANRRGGRGRTLPRPGPPHAAAIEAAWWPPWPTAASSSTPIPSTCPSGAPCRRGPARKCPECSDSPAPSRQEQST